MTRMTATEVARAFSIVLNRVATGEEVEIVRSGAPVAVIGPPRIRTISADRFRALLASAPPPDADFGHAVRELRSSMEPPADPWPS